MFKNFIFLVLIICKNTTTAQIIFADASPNNNEFIFTPLFIKNNGIKEITTALSTKKEGEKIKTKNEIETKTFYLYGLIEKEASYFLSKNGNDSLVNLYQYNKNLLPICKTTYDYSGLSSLCTEYLDNEMPTREIYSKIETTTDSTTLEKKLITHQISIEEFKYMANGSQLIKRVFNSNGKEYKQEKKTVDELGYLKEISINYIVNNFTSNFQFTYNQNGFLETKLIFDNADLNYKTRYQYKYDAKNNITEIYTFRNDELISERQFIYNQNNYFLDAMLQKDSGTNFIRIVKYRYLYH